jgi:hypothetical protein
MDAKNNSIMTEFIGFQFHNNWDCLMEVVIKLKRITDEDIYIESLTVKQLDLLMIQENQLNMVLQRNDLNLIDVYNTCIIFIKWYNKNN